LDGICVDDACVRVEKERKKERERERESRERTRRESVHEKRERAI
jgi:hypothetical protein